MNPTLLAVLLLPTLAGAEKPALLNTKRCLAAEQAAVDAALPRAQERVAAMLRILDPAGPERAKRAEAERLRPLLFGSGVSAESARSTIERMGRILAEPDRLRCVRRQDAYFKFCKFRAGFVVRQQGNAQNDPEIYLCPDFFKAARNRPVDEGADAAEQRVRTLIHESAHQAGNSEASGESYCIVFDCSGPCASQGSRVADNWAQYVHCASGQPPDEGDVITVDRPAGK